MADASVGLACSKVTATSRARLCQNGSDEDACVIGIATAKSRVWQWTREGGGVRLGQGMQLRKGDRAADMINGANA